MTITDAKWVDAADGGGRLISAVVDGVQMWVPPDPKNRHYAEILRQNIEVSDAL